MISQEMNHTQNIQEHHPKWARRRQHAIFFHFVTVRVIERTSVECRGIPQKLTLFMEMDGAQDEAPQSPKTMHRAVST